MNQISSYLVVLMTFAACCGNGSADDPHAADFYVSPQGSDAWTGTLAAPSTSGNDGPFATLERARDAVRQSGKRSSADVVVLVRGGTYQLTQTVVFGLQDSGTNDSTITYAAYPGETPVFSSGQEITGWQKVTVPLPRLPEAAQGNVWVASVSEKFLTLYDDHGMLPRAQSERFVPSGSSTELRFPEGELKNWPNVKDVEIVVRPTRLWTMNVLPLVAIDEKARTARTAIPATYGMNKIGCWVENVLEELDKPGEWALNTQEGKVYLWPRGDSPIMAPQLIELIRIEGEVDKQGPKDIPVRNLCFRGLTFKHGERYTLAKDDAGTQHDWDMFDKANTLVRLRGAENCVIEDCHFLHSGSGAIRVDLHGQQNTFSGNHIEHLGGGGILLCGYGPGTKDVNKKNVVSQNHIHHIGEIYWHSPGIFLCQSGENRVANNLIHHANYSGMIVSGIVTRFFTKQNKRESSRAIRWNEIRTLPKNPSLEAIRPYLHTRNNLIENNEIHNVMQILGDGNGIYVRGAGAGNVIRGNYIHHLVSSINGQSGMRTDGGQMDTLFTGNLLYKCRSQGMTLKLNNRFENNIIADVIAPRGTYLKIVEGPMKGASNKRNIYYSTLADCTFVSEPGVGKGKVGEDRRGRVPARMSDIDSDYNIYYCKADNSRSDGVLRKLQADGVDTNSRANDPMFVDPENGDFRFQSDSPALEMGIVPFDLSKVGLRPASTTK
ncbi:Right handed beta helix region [Neorhodopirellula lusitana]|uniref:Right handed beta helix region n=1 Tax=Neorhodopirellula lusitana TaxID=445327 RepID=A0ABY1Q0K1_9BACT|nr:right-handed parallel beta-helix repeat-containing protein [Neorhodopirellula lusitana]SMP55648.1 Right handed beta helix region [Neorhodopirellula lusitana]